MPRTVGIGHQDFGKLRMKNNFYIDKTAFIREWWESDDEVTLITRPRRFGKTLNMSMAEQFFSCKYAGKEACFAGLDVWEHEKYRRLQGTYPVTALSFSDIKERKFEGARKKICKIIQLLYNQFHFLLYRWRLIIATCAEHGRSAASTYSCECVSPGGSIYLAII